MYRRIGDGNDDVLGYRLTGRVTEGEFKEIQREMEAAIEEHGKVRVLCEMGDLSGADPSAIWQDLKFTPTYMKDLERFALVGDKRWHKVVNELSDRLGFAVNDIKEDLRTER